MKSFIQNFFVKPPVIFPLVACFLVFLSINEAGVSLFSSDVESYYKLRPVLMIAMTIFWIATTFFQRWGALGFVILTLFSVGTYYFSDSLALKSVFGNLLLLKLPIGQGSAIPIPLSAIFAFIALYFYPKMN